jgi:hypothetical protein
MRINPRTVGTSRRSWDQSASAYLFPVYPKR